MKSRRSFKSLLSLLFSALLAFPEFSPGQLAVGQYEPEAPLRTWNLFGPESAAALGRGHTSLAYAEDPASALTNPSLLAGLEGLHLSLNGARSSASLYRYALVNTGVLTSDENLSLDSLVLDFGGLSLRAGSWAFGLSASIYEIYDRPGIDYEYSSQGQPAYGLAFNQNGFLRVFNFSVARRFGRRLKVGLGMNLANGSLERETVENYPRSGITISDRKEHDFTGAYLNGGMTAALCDRLDVALVFRTPYVRTADSRSRLRYSAPAGGTDIRIDAEAEDRFEQPLVLGLGLSFVAWRSVRILADLLYFNWSDYSVTFFGEEMERNFRDTIRLGLGGETSLRINVLGSVAALPLRIGLIYDPQPMREPTSAYTSFTVGTGIRWRMIALDLGASLGSEKGSGRSLEARRVALSLGVRL